MKTHIVLLLIVLCCFCIGSDGGLFKQPRYWVKVWNGLSNHYPLTIHCRSKDDDLGVRVLPFENVFKWSFRTMNHWFGYTLFWCNFAWAQHHVSVDVFYEHDTFLEVCDQRECVWVARDDGVYVKSLKYNAYLKFYNWTVTV